MSDSVIVFHFFLCVSAQVQLCQCVWQLEEPAQHIEKRGREGGSSKGKREWNKEEKGEGIRRRRSSWMCRGLYELWGFPTVTDNRWRQGALYDNRLFDPGQASRGEDRGARRERGCPHLPQKRQKVSECTSVLCRLSAKQCLVHSQVCGACVLMHSD